MADDARLNTFLDDDAVSRAHLCLLLIEGQRPNHIREAAFC